MYAILINTAAILVSIVMLVTVVFTVPIPFALLGDYCWEPKWLRKVLAVLSLPIGCFVVAALYELLNYLVPTLN